MFFIYLLLTILFFLVIKVKFNIAKHNHRRPPGPWTLPIIGSLHHFIRSGLPHHTLRNLSQLYGRVMFLQIGERPTIVISSIEGARIIIKTHETTFCNRPENLTAKIFTYGGKDLVLSPFGEYWRDIRRILMIHLLSPKRVQSFRSIREEEVLELIQLISLLSSDRQTINLSEIISVMANKVSMRAITGSKSKEGTEMLMVNELQRSAVLATGFGISNLFPSSRLARLISGQVRETEECHESIDQLLDMMIREHNKKMVDDQEADGLLSVLLRLLDDDNTINMDSAKAVLFNAIGGGTHTTTAVFEWVMSELVRNPGVMQKAQDEVRKLRGHKIITESDIAELDFLHLVIRETLRLHPVAPLIPRVCPETFDILGHQIPEGATVVVNMWAIGRDSEYWKEPEEFLPERFAEENKDGVDSRGTNVEFFPFGAGRRICPGNSFGMAIVEVVVANLLYHFDWELPSGLRPEDLDMTESFGINIGRKLPLMLCAVSHASG